jgi:hypothetical protein
VSAVPIPLPPDGRRTVVNVRTGLAHETRSSDRNAAPVTAICGRDLEVAGWGRTHATRLCGQCYRGRRGEGA